MLLIVVCLAPTAVLGGLGDGGGGGDDGGLTLLVRRAAAVPIGTPPPAQQVATARASVANSGPPFKLSARAVPACRVVDVATVVGVEDVACAGSALYVRLAADVANGLRASDTLEAALGGGGSGGTEGSSTVLFVDPALSCASADPLQRDNSGRVGPYWRVRGRAAATVRTVQLGDGRQAPVRVVVCGYR